MVSDDAICAFYPSYLACITLALGLGGIKSVNVSCQRPFNHVALQTCLCATAQSYLLTAGAFDVEFFQTFSRFHANF